ncbi:MAG: tRNA pseudouridine(54/55) synthase Pus10 [Thermoplasmata archaeon]|nr:tRNA pseudouridine(54/55) synthase Pus10 [Thermoplasmata archaeon]
MKSLFDTVNALSKRQLCDRCLGRQFGRLGTGTTDEERGRTIKLFLAMTEEYGEVEGVQSRFLHAGGEEKDCALCKGLFNELNKFVDLVVDALSDHEFETFLIGSVVDEEILERESGLQKEFALASHAEGIKNELNREIGIRVFERLEKEASFERPDIVAVVDTRFDTVTLQVAPIFIYGRYLKFDRTIPQTIWNCKRCRGRGCEYCNHTGKIYQTSVQELIGDAFLKETGGTRHLFHGMGREDIDARMLGNGRPFILEISNPKRRLLDLERMREMVNTSASGRVEIYNLRYTNRDNVSRIKNEKAEKTYRAEVEFEDDVGPEKIDELIRKFSGTLIHQRTPARVSHRRSDLIREKKVININCELQKGKRAAFTIRGESGLYIKELIHGDEGRTQPSISDFLGTGCKVASLDVLAVHYE